MEAPIPAASFYITDNRWCEVTRGPGLRFTFKVRTTTAQISAFKRHVNRPGDEVGTSLKLDLNSSTFLRYPGRDGNVEMWHHTDTFNTVLGLDRIKALELLDALVPIVEVGELIKGGKGRLPPQGPPPRGKGRQPKSSEQRDTFFSDYRPDIASGSAVLYLAKRSDDIRGIKGVLDTYIISDKETYLIFDSQDNIRAFLKTHPNAVQIGSRTIAERALFIYSNLPRVKQGRVVVCSLNREMSRMAFVRIVKKVCPDAEDFCDYYSLDANDRLKTQHLGIIFPDNDSAKEFVEKLDRTIGTAEVVKPDDSRYPRAARSSDDDDSSDSDSDDDAPPAPKNKPPPPSTPADLMGKLFGGLFKPGGIIQQVFTTPAAKAAAGHPTEAEMAAAVESLEYDPEEAIEEDENSPDAPPPPPPVVGDSQRRIDTALTEMDGMPYCAAKSDFTCCKGCGHNAIDPILSERNSYIFYHHQDTQDAFDSDGRMTDDLLLSWCGNGRRLCDLLEARGLKVVWNGDDNQRIRILKFNPGEPAEEPVVDAEEDGRSPMRRMMGWIRGHPPEPEDVEEEDD